MEDMKYPIRAVCKLTGLTTDTVRAWERRYKAVQPKHERGGRLYAREDVHRLLLLKEAVNNGHRIGKIANLSDAQLKSLANAAQSRNETGGDREETQKIARILSLCRSYDYASVDAELEQLAAFMRPLDFIHRIVIPLIDSAEAQAEKQRMSLAQKHMLFVLARSILGSLTRLQVFRDASERPMLFTTLPQGVYEIGALMASALAAAHGVRTLYLGPNLPVADIAQASRKANVAAVALWLSVEAGANVHTAGMVGELRQNLAKTTRLIVGGRALPAVRDAIEGAGALTAADYEAFESLLT